MKKLFYILILITGMTNAQIVNIPDANFKAKLLAADVSNDTAYGNGGYIKIDANNDGEIQVLEAQSIDSLDVHFSGIYDLTGVSSFNNLKGLNCNSNQLTDLDLSSLTSLKKLYCSSNSISNLNLTGLTNLIFLGCSYNQLSTLNLATVSSLEYLSCNINSLTSLNIAGLTNLQTLNCNYNQLPSLNFSGLINLKDLYCTDNLLTDINVSGLINLQTLQCINNQLTSLDLAGLNNLTTIGTGNNQLVSLNVTGLTSLIELNCFNNLLTTLNATGLTNLKYLYCDSNQLSDLDVSGSFGLITLSCNSNQLSSLNVNALTQMNYLSCGDNQLTSLDLSTLDNLAYFYCSSNLLTTLDCNNNHQLSQLQFSDNPNLTTVLVKNGIEEFNIDSFLDLNCPNLNFVCADDFQTTFLTANLPSSVYVNTYCTFTPGGNYNTITGTVTFDGNNNGCDAADDIQPNVRVNINEGTNQGATFTNNSGNYTFYTQSGSFVLTPAMENPTYFNFSPTTATIPFANNNNNTTTQNFCISANGVHPDLEIVIAPIFRARPGFDATYKIVYKNKGNQTLSGNVTFSYDDAILDFVSATVVPNSQSVGTMSWNYTNLLPFESRSIEIVFNVNAPTETPAVNIGDQLDFNATITPIASDEIPADNVFSLKQIVVGSYDPNDITCLEGDIVSPTEIGNYLHYNIRFENTGTAAAEFVVVKVEVNQTDFDMNSLQIMNSSDPVDARINQNIVEFIFQNIQLESGGHGNILLKIKSKNNLLVGDEVNKKANIYFDYNFPILTNDAETVFQSLNNPDFQNDASISVYPNPTNGIVTVNCNNSIKSIQLYDVQGRLLQTNLVNENETSIDVSNKYKGVYFLKILSDKGMKVEKIVRE
ncbi:T9SS type A sorting domain-containing protein [Flavobacterium sp.]|uniref:T9SS type A sorting domain-containing protein n=1 Tax=Flavobacterium sp. TaxID=239 RepID=UPI00391A06A6